MEYETTSYCVNTVELELKSTVARPYSVTKKEEKNIVLIL